MGRTPTAEMDDTALAARLAAIVGERQVLRTQSELLVYTADGLRRATELGWLARLASSFSGQAPYRVSLAILQGHPEFTLTTLV